MNMFKQGELVRYKLNPKCVNRSERYQYGLVLHISEYELFCSTDRLCTILTRDGARKRRMLSSLERVTQ